MILSPLHTLCFAGKSSGKVCDLVVPLEPFGIIIIGAGHGRPGLVFQERAQNPDRIGPNGPGNPQELHDVDSALTASSARDATPCVTG